MSIDDQIFDKLSSMDKQQLQRELLKHGPEERIHALVKILIAAHDADTTKRAAMASRRISILSLIVAVISMIITAFK